MLIFSDSLTKAAAAAVAFEIAEKCIPEGAAWLSGSAVRAFFIITRRFFRKSPPPAPLRYIFNNVEKLGVGRSDVY